MQYPYRTTKKHQFSRITRKEAFDACSEVPCECGFMFTMDHPEQKYCQECLDADTEWEAPDKE